MISISADEVSARLTKAVGDDDECNSRMKPNRKHLFTQNGILSETPSATPSTKLKTENVHTKKKVRENNKKGKRTKLIKNAEGEKVAKPPETNFKVPKSVGIKKKLRRKGSIESEASESSSIRSRKYVSRKSSMDFVKQDELSRRKRKSTKVARNCIVATSLSQEDSQLLRQLLKSLGRFTLQEGGQVTSSTSHVVCGMPVRRTINLLKGLSRGCWLLSRDWLFASLEKGRWADEEDYELVDFSAAVRRARQEREAFGRRSQDLLKSLPAMYFSARGCRAPAEELRQLALLAGAEVARVARAAGVVVGEKVRRQSSEGEDVVCVQESWFFDSLQRQEVLPFDGHLL